MTPDIETFERELEDIEGQEYLEQRRHLVRMAELRALSERAKKKIAQARARHQESQERFALKVNAIRDDLLPKVPRMFSGKTTVNPHRFTMALKTRGLRVNGWAADHSTKADPVTKSRVLGWVQPPTVTDNAGKTIKNKRFRKIPDKFAKIIAEEFPECPADETTWIGGILKSGESQGYNRKWHRGSSAESTTAP